MTKDEIHSALVASGMTSEAATEAVNRFERESTYAGARFMKGYILLRFGSQLSSMIKELVEGIDYKEVMNKIIYKE